MRNRWCDLWMVVTSSQGFTTLHHNSARFIQGSGGSREAPTFRGFISADQSTVVDSTHAVQVEIAADDAHGAGRIAVRVDDVRGRPPVAVDMTLADSDTESAVSEPTI